MGFDIKKVLAGLGKMLAGQSNPPTNPYGHERTGLPGDMGNGGYGSGAELYPGGNPNVMHYSGASRAADGPNRGLDFSGDFSGQAGSAANDAILRDRAIAALDLPDPGPSPDPSKRTRALAALDETPTGEVADGTDFYGNAFPYRRPHTPAGGDISLSPPRLDFSVPYNQPPATAQSAPSVSSQNPQANPQISASGAATASASPSPATAAPPPASGYGDYLPKSVKDIYAAMEAVRAQPPPVDNNGRLRTFGAVAKHRLGATLQGMAADASRNPSDYGPLDFLGSLAAGVLGPSAAAALGGKDARATDERMARQDKLTGLDFQMGQALEREGAVAGLVAKRAGTAHTIAETNQILNPHAKEKHYQIVKASDPATGTTGYAAVNDADPSDRFQMPDLGQANPTDYEVREIEGRMVAVNKNRPQDRIDLGAGRQPPHKGISAKEIPDSVFGLKSEGEMTDEARAAISKISRKTRATDVNPAILTEGSPYRNADGTPNTAKIWDDIGSGDLKIAEAFTNVTAQEANDVEQSIAAGRERIRGTQAERRQAVDTFRSIVQTVTDREPPAGARVVHWNDLARILMSILDNKDVKARAKDLQDFYNELYNLDIR